MPTNPSQNCFRVSYYRAPSVNAVTPFKIAPGFEIIELVTRGVVFFQSGRHALKLGCGAMFWHVAGDETIFRTKASDPYECLSIFFSANPGATRLAPRLTLITDRQRAVELSREILHAYHDAAVDRDALARYAYARFHWEAHLGSIRHTTPIQPPSLTAALAHLEKHFTTVDLGVGELAKAGGISEPHLYVVFRQHLEQTPHQALLARRLHEAKILLSGTDQSIKSLPALCGFAGIEVFYRAFRKHIGMTPLDYRERHLATSRAPWHDT